jgi:ribosomal protein L35AE/L33A
MYLIDGIYSFKHIQIYIYIYIFRPHGNGGVVKARFRKNLPAKSFGASVRVVSILMLCIY